MPENIHFIKQNSTLPFIEDQFLDGNGNAIVLTGWAIKVRMQPFAGGALTLNNVAGSLLDQGGSPLPAGYVRYYFQAADTATPGKYRFEFEADPPGGGAQTMPPDTYHEVIITPILPLS